MKVTGAAVPSSRAIASGTFATMRSVGTTQMWRSGRSVSARRPWPGPASRMIVPVSAIASAQVGEHAVGGREGVAVEGWGVGEQLEALGCVRGWQAFRDEQAPGVVALAGRRHRARRPRRRRPGRPWRGSRRRARRSGRRRRARGRRAGRARRGARRPARRRARCGSARGSRHVALTAPPVSERLLRGREVAGLGPARHRARQPPLDLPVAGQRPGAEPCRALGRLVAAAAREHARHRLHRQPLAGHPRPPAVALGLAHDAPAQVHEHRGDVDLDRADLVAGAAQRGRPRQRRRGAQPLQLRREDRADRAGVGRLVRVPAGALVDRAHVQARRAADAVQRLAADRVGEHVGAAGVEQHEVERLRAVAGRHARPQRRVRVHALAGRGARQQLQHHAEVGEARQDLLDPHHRDQHVRQRRAHAPVALGLDHAHGAGLGDREVRPADPHAHAQERLAQMAARGLGQSGRLVGQVLGARQLAPEQLADLGPVAVDRGHEDVRLAVVRRAARSAPRGRSRAR